MSKGGKAIVIIGGGMKKDARGRWRTTTFREGDNFGALGDRLRVEAGAYLYQDNPEITIVALGGKGQYGDMPDVPTVSGLIRDELVEMGVNKKNIIIEENSGATWQQIQELKKIIQEHNFSEITIISNKYHLPRIEAMMEQDQEMKEILAAGNIKLEAAEEILIEKEPKWQKEIEEAYQSKAMKERIKLEEKGVRDLKEGKYNIK